MSAEKDADARPDAGSDDDSLDHYFCDYCDDPDVALCGANIAANEYATDDEGDELNLPCVVCQDLRYRTCPRCGVLP